MHSLPVSKRIGHKLRCLCHSIITKTTKKKRTKTKQTEKVNYCLKRHPCVLKMELIFSFDTMLMTLRQQINPKQDSHMATTSARNDQRSSHKIHSLSNDRCIAANRVKQFKVLTPLLFKQPPVMIATETEMSWFRARGHRDWGLGEDRTPHLPVESHWSRIHSGYCCALRPSAIKTIHL